MALSTKPNQADLQYYLAQRRAEPRTPPPSLEEIRRQLGWGLVQPIKITTTR